MSDRPNRPVPDELAETRAEIKRLQDRESELKRILLTQPDTREGIAWLAEVKEIVTTSVDLKELRAMHKDLVDEYTFPRKVTRVELSGVTSDGELVPARRFRNETGA